jgi:hypothetical protein
MSIHGSNEHSQLTGGISRRTALLRGGATGAAAAVIGALSLGRRTLAQEAMTAPAGWHAEHLEVTVLPHDPVSVTVAGSGPPQRGDHFYVDAPIYARGDEAGSEIGTYQCFGAWTAAADDMAAPNQRLTTVQFILADGSIMGLINEGGTGFDDHIGAVQGGSGAYAGALGTFMQITREAAATGTPGATPAPTPLIVDTNFDLFLPGEG